ncbi:hypothetical protein L6R46_21435 [Myxococcota bacterium]|nr:hypothetical protein [Myxococcota bacterium]
MILLVWLIFSFVGCELKVIVDYPGETGLDTGSDTEADTGADTGAATAAADDNF